MMSPTLKFRNAFLSLLSLLFATPQIAIGQQSEIGFGTPPVTESKIQCLTPEQREEALSILRSIQKNSKTNSTQSEEILFEWPVKQSDNYSEPQSIGISNYVDLASNFPDNLLDYNCGQRTYDTSNGYNHQGTDIYSWPFSWKKMDTDQIEIVAAAAGTITFKRSDRNDKSCSFNNNQWNAIYIQHDDGSIAWYGHLKQQSLTQKEVGERVETGEYLGIMGSSGNSTGPHLHFEVYDSDGNLIDPYLGSCNSTTDRSWWANQEDYHVPQLSNLYTHHSPPAFGCYGEEFPNIEANFNNGETVYFATYYRDQLQNSTSTHRVYKPDGSLFQSWTTSPDRYFSGSYWWRSFTMPTTGDHGKWTFTVEYHGQELTEHFYVNESEDNGEVSIAIDTLFFEDTPVGSKTQKTFTISNTGSSAVYIESIDLPSSFSGNWDGRIYHGESKEITLQFQPTYNDIFEETLTLNTRASGTKTLVLSGTTGEDITRVLGADEVLDFGTITEGTSSTRNTSISNTGNSPLVISSIMYPEGFTGFTSLTVEPGESENLIVSFRPTEARGYEGVLTMESNSTGGPTEIRLTGVGGEVLSVDGEGEIIIYPNPNSTGILKFNSIVDRAEIFDSSGKLLKAMESQTQMNISDLRPGLYFVTINQDSDKKSIKLIVN